MASVDNPLEVFFDLVPTGAALYSPLYDASGELVDFRFARLNPAGQRLLGLPAQPPRTFREYYPNSVPTGIFAQFRTAYLTGEASTYEVPYEGDGIDTYFRLVAQRSGELLVVNFTDLGDLPRSAVEQTLRESRAREQVARAEAEAQRQRFYDLLMQLPAHVAVHDGPDQVFTLVNPYYQRLAPDRTLLGLPIREAWPELVSQGILNVLDQVYQTGEPFIATELPVQADFTRTGLLEQVYYNFFFLALRDAQGQINGVLNFSYDVTASVVARQQVEQLNAELETRVQARTKELAAVNEALIATNEKLHQSNAQLTRTNVDLDTFVYTASHDLKAPITNIESITLAMRDTLPATVQQDDMISHLLDLLEQTTTRFQVTIGQLTDVSKLQLAHAGPAELVNLAAVVESVRLDLVPAIKAANAQLTVEVAPDLLVSFSSANVRSAIYNLLSNALKYRAFDRPAAVWVRAFSAGPRVGLEIQDNGLGISELQQRQLFGLFQRLHTHVEGTGVGLYITKRLVENGGGTIAVQSQVDAGTTFTLTFPT